MNEQERPASAGRVSSDQLGLDDITVHGTPRRVWLVVGDIDEACDFDMLADVTWCDAPQYDHDVEYVRADLVRAAMPGNWQDDPDTLALAKVLGLDKENARAYGFEA
jgi:hypothetical protein